MVGPFEAKYKIGQLLDLAEPSDGAHYREHGHAVARIAPPSRVRDEARRKRQNAASANAPSGGNSARPTGPMEDLSRPRRAVSVGPDSSAHSRGSSGTRRRSPSPGSSTP